MIGPLLFGAIDLTFDVLEAGVHGVKRAQQFWRVVRPAPPPEGALSFKDVAHQREQMRAATSRGTVQGPTPQRGQ